MPTSPVTPRRILLIRPSALGDVCRSVPAIVSLRRAYPGAHIDWLVQDSFADAVRFHPGLTGIVPFSRTSMGRALLGGRPGQLIALVRLLRTARYDMVYDLQGLFRSGFFARATGAPRRVGYADARELGWLGLNERHPAPAGMHAVERMFELLRLSGVEPIPDLRLYPGEAARDWLASQPGLSRAPYAVIAPTSRWPAKRWPTQRFVRVAEHLVSRGLTVVVVGSASERDQCGPLLEPGGNRAGIVDLVGRTTVAQLMALIERAGLVIACDSAPLHMAVGFDRPLVALFGPTRVERVGPYRRQPDVIQHVAPGDTLDHKDPAGGLRLMDRIGADEVIAAADARL
jgi:heptosyltransferase-1